MTLVATGFECMDGEVEDVVRRWVAGVLMATTGWLALARVMLWPVLSPESRVLRPGGELNLNLLLRDR